MEKVQMELHDNSVETGKMGFPFIEIRKPFGKSSYGRGTCLQFFILFRGLRCPFSVQVENCSFFFPFEIGFPSVAWAALYITD